MPADPYQYFRIEAKELLGQMTQGVLLLEKGEQSVEVVARLLRWAHTLKGAARIVKQNEISQLAHDFETAIEPLRTANPGQPAPRSIINELLRLADSIVALVKKLDKNDEPSDILSLPSPADEFDTIRIPIHEMDTLFNEVSESVVQVQGLKQNMMKISNASQEKYYREDLDSLIDKLEGQLLMIRGELSEHRLLPAHVIFPVLQRAARDAAEALGKNVEFEGVGGETHIDPNVLSPIRGALIQMVRNSVAHGIEKKGKVRVTVERQGNKIGFTCEDDGRGIDLDAIRNAAQKSGENIQGDLSNFGTQEAIELIRKGGISTAKKTTEVSGRGVGLNLVWDTVKRLKGEISVQSKPGLGMKIALSVPSSLESLQVLLVQAGSIDYAIPLDSILQVLWINSQDIVHSGEGETMLFEGSAIPFVPLARISTQVSRSRTTHRIALVLRIREQRFALEVDQIKEVSQVIVRPIPKFAGSHPWIAGAFFEVHGNPRFVLEPEKLIPLLISSKPVSVPSQTQKKLSILVIDDSLTSRMLEQSILESAGYDVKAVPLPITSIFGSELRVSTRWFLTVSESSTTKTRSFRSFIIHPITQSSLEWFAKIRFR